MATTTALLIEDEESIALIIEDLLSLHNVQVLRAESASQALELLESSSVNFIITDLKLPDMYGVQLYRQISQMRPELKDKFLFMSGFESDEELEEILQETGSRFIQKPFQIQDFNQIIQQFI